MEEQAKNFHPQKDYPLYWGFVIEDMTLQLVGELAQIKEQQNFGETTLYFNMRNDGLNQLWIVFMVDQFLPAHAKPEIQKFGPPPQKDGASKKRIYIRMGMEAWSALCPSAYAFALSFAEELQKTLCPVPEIDFRLCDIRESVSHLSILFQWRPLIKHIDYEVVATSRVRAPMDFGNEWRNRDGDAFFGHENEGN